MTNSSTYEMYPYTYIYKEKRIVLIWQTNELKGDFFKIDGEKKLLKSNSKKGFLDVPEVDFNKVHWSEGAEIDFDKFWTSLANLRLNRASSQITCERLLDGWNFIEDMLRTFNLKDDLELLKMPILNKIYKKLFAGNNIVSITPKNTFYSPLWTQEELLNFRSVFRSIWSNLIKLNLIEV